MKTEDVAHYLVNHPDFFNEYADLLNDLQIPHPHQNNVVSLHERQAIALRDKNKVLQDKLLELISFGEENDAISEKMHRLTIALLTAYNFDDFLNGLQYCLREDFAIPYFVMRIWGLDLENKDYDEFAETSEDVHAIAASLNQPYCGNHVADGIKALFAENGEHLQSFSMIPLNTTRPIGLLVLASPEIERFYADMGTLHLKRLGELISASIARHSLTVDNPSQNHDQHPIDGQPV
ncbi:DUF484 family protein [Nitrosomonas sp.]|uniref:DUF484 family protein n=1 Tax=Nitrosomonas sp. TaxID=42353 RepID=UPI001E1875BE|nr:DUF484 family protein [Nitrosomonas sp.]MCB1949072.1 DUF484 family protein [Nitrosomonas sp.]MCP5244029.1 DUF484 family protein [Burkholderiales bacterium]MDR4514301.1 DUF484 family protein [Nitrosomonas sp.]